MKKVDYIPRLGITCVWLLMAGLFTFLDAQAQEMTHPRDRRLISEQQVESTLQPLGVEALARIEATIDSFRQAKQESASAAKSGREGARRKIHTALWDYVEAVQAAPAGKAAQLRQHPMLQLDASGAVQVKMRLSEASGAEVAALQGVQANVQFIRADRNVVFARIPTDRILDVAAFDFVRSVEPVFAGSGIVHTGSFTTEGDVLLGGPVIRNNLGIDGTGVRIAVISNGTQGIETAVASGDIPDDGSGNPDVDFCPTGTDPGDVPVVNQGSEGTAMLEIIHDLAPGAELGFCPAFGDPAIVDVGQAGLAASIDYLANNAFGGQGANVIVDDVAFLTEPYFEDGIVAQAVDNAAGGGATYFSSAGNSATAHYEASYVDTTPGDQLTFPDNAHDFGLAAGGPSTIVLQGLVAGGNNFFAAFLQWNDPFGASGNDYDVYIFDQFGFPAGDPAGDFPIGANGISTQDGDDDPLEVAFVVNTNNATGDPVADALPFVIVIDRFSGDPNKELEMNYNGFFGLDPTFNVPEGSVWGHSAAAGAISVGAIDHETPSVIEPFSSQGPSRIYFPTFEARNTPTLASYDGVTVTGAGGFPTEFFGTSAAAPHAAGVAALLQQADPSLDPSGVRSELISTATDLGAPGFDFVYGNGRVEGIAVVAKSACDSPILAGGDVLDDDAQTVTNTVTDGDGVAQLEFTMLNNVSVTGVTSSAGNFTSNGDGTVWTAPTDPGPQSATYTLQATANSGSYFVVATDDCPVPRTTDFDPPYAFALEAPDQFAVMGNYPNPFRSTTKIRFALPERGPVTLAVYDVMGRRVATIIESEMAAGVHDIAWNGRAESGQPLASGVYLYRLEAGTNVATQRLTLIR